MTATLPALAFDISAEASAVLAVMSRSLRHPRSTAAAEHPLISYLKALRHLVFFPATAASSLLLAGTLRPSVEAVRSEEAAAAVTSASLTALREVMALMWHSLPGSTLREVDDAVASCRFEAGAEANDEEAVLMQVCSPACAVRAPAAPCAGKPACLHRSQQLLRRRVPVHESGHPRDFCLSFFPLSLHPDL